MAKDKRPVAEQVADLTPQQRKNVVRVGLISTLVALLMGVLLFVLAVFPLFDATSEHSDARDYYDVTVNDYDKAEATWELNEYSSLSFRFTAQGIELWEKREMAMLLWEEAENNLKQELLINVIALGVFIVVSLIGVICLYKIFPYYSERKCYYILFHRKQFQ